MAEESEWLAQQRLLAKKAKQVLAQAEAECAQRAMRRMEEGVSTIDHDNALEWLFLATVATDIDSRRPVVEIIKLGLATVTEAWAEAAQYVALGEMTEEAADVFVAAKVEEALLSAILRADWPGLLNEEEIASMSTLLAWAAVQAGESDQPATDV